MNVHTTNYRDTFIAVADDCPAMKGEVPPIKGDKKSVAAIQFDLIVQHPYRFTSDDVLFRVYAERNDLTAAEWDEARVQYFSKGQPCFRASPLTKRYGWGIHSDANGKIALYGCETPEYGRFVRDPGISVVKAMKSRK